ncbi:GntR family transcriptional regulator [Bacillus solitudinis]|uniref:GntR family transcriptional regulator n=1 Tax=Bacillus solitudinis TaxID=2014074 RepID=UPI000C232BCC|nr:GntR family transcriptional regulator [Bacillus solitudinis]
MAKKYDIVKQEIKSWILKGHIQPNQRIKSEHELVEHFEVSRQTIRQALGALVEEGWLYKEHGVGTFCNPQKIVTSSVIANEQEKAKQKSVAMISTHISDYIFPSMIRGAESFFTERGIILYVVSTGGDHTKERDCLEQILERNVDGLIIEPTKSAVQNPNIDYYLHLESKGIPYIMLNSYYTELNPPHLAVDDEKGGYLVTKHLLDLGHHHLSGIFNTDDMQGVLRLKGFIQAHREALIPIDPDLLITFKTFEEELLSNKVQAMMTSDQVPTGIVCHNDKVAVLVLNLLKELQINVPEEMSVTGYDDSYLVASTGIQLTSVTHPKSKIGEEAAKRIYEVIMDQKSIRDLSSTVYEPQLVVRHSTGKPQSKTERVEPHSL